MRFDFLRQKLANLPQEIRSLIKYETEIYDRIAEQIKAMFDYSV